MIAGATYASCFALFCAIARSRWAQLDPRRPAFGAFGVLGLIAAVVIGRDASLASVSHAALLAFVAVAAITDVSTGYVFDVVTAAAGAVVVGLAALQGAFWNGAGGALLAFAPLAMLYAATRGRAMGLGDVKLASVIGAGVGASGALTCIGSAFVAGALWGVCALARGASVRDSVAFAPFLALGAALSLYAGGGQWLIG